MYSLPYLTLDKDVRQVRQSDLDAFAAQIRGGALRPHRGSAREWVAIDRFRGREAHGEAGSRGANRLDGRVARRCLERLRPAGVARMDVHGERAGPLYGDRVSSQFSRCLRHRGVL